MGIIDIDPVAISLGPLQIRWYGVMYVLGFLQGGYLLKILSKENFFPCPPEKIDKFLTYMLIGMFFGARFVYVFVYNWDYYSNNLVELLSVWKGGLSFHGSVLGFAIASIIFAKKEKVNFVQLWDSACLIGTPGIFWGRLGNFINGELWGRKTDAAIGTIFKNDPTGLARHPSQLYEAVGEGIFVFLIMWMLRKKIKSYGQMTALFFLFYGLMRFIIEFFREPDQQLGYFFSGILTMGQILCLIMILMAPLFYYISMKKGTKVNLKLS